MDRRNHPAVDALLEGVGTWMRIRSGIPAALLALVLYWFFAVTVSSGQSSERRTGSGDGSAAAIERFWAVFHGNDYAAIPELQKDLEAALEWDPENVTLTALLGATHFWHVGEYRRDPSPSPTVLAEDMPDAVEWFNKALELDYSPHPVGYVYNDHLPGFLGVTTVHLGQGANDSALIAKGDQWLNYSVYQFPEFNNFNRWAAYNSDRNTSDSYKLALDSLWQAMDACIEGRIDRTNPDITPYLHLQTSVGRKSTCWSENSMAPHSFEGLMLNLGNGLVKAGQVDVAKIVYTNARYAKHYAKWPYRQVLESIAASDLNARAALYDDNDPTNDPPLAVPNRSCVYCHATVAEPAVH